DWSWTEKLTFDRQAKLLPTAANFKLIMEHHPHVRGMLIYNDFSSRFEVLRRPPWRPAAGVGAEHWGEADDAGLTNWLEDTYQVRKPSVLKDVLAEYRYIHHYHPVRDYLRGLEWDGEPRADTVLIDFLGAEDSAYVRTVTRKMLLAAVARVFQPGIKFDYMLVFVGGQGIGKSYFIKRLGGKWASDSATSMSGKESFEQLQGKWILEFGELAAMRKMEIEQVKFYISKDTDSFRPAYGYRVEDYPRQCVFFGSTNNQYFLKDPTGNRRFWPVEVNEGHTRKLFDDFNQEYIDQVWAEMVHAWDHGERRLYLTEDEEKEAFARQQAHREISDKAGMVEVYLDTPLPEKWNDWSIEQRQTQFDSASDVKVEGKIKRDRVCVAEIWTECFQGAQGKMQRRDANEIHEIMMTMPGWERYTEGGGKLDFGPYGKQRSYVRIEK
ncbi:MAG: virulence-associated E family protein, partial [Haemophilus parainfluenzae]|nr:virulence-associated E family protein [Haemophilus parainfluenzae]